MNIKKQSLISAKTEHDAIARPLLGCKTASWCQNCHFSPFSPFSSIIGYFSQNVSVAKRVVTHLGKYTQKMGLAPTLLLGFCGFVFSGRLLCQRSEAGWEGVVSAQGGCPKVGSGTGGAGGLPRVREGKQLLLIPAGRALQSLCLYYKGPERARTRALVLQSFSLGGRALAGPCITVFSSIGDGPLRALVLQFSLLGTGPSGPLYYSSH